jgi:hypothetical protein
MSESKVRMDRGKVFATVHGERAPGDRHAAVHYFQDGLPFDVGGYLIPDHPDLMGDDPKAKKLRELAERKIKRAEKAAKEKPAAKSDDDADGEDAEAESDDRDEEVNLEAWARGEKDYQWLDITQTIARRYNKRVKDKEAALDLLIEEKVVTVDDLPPHFRKLIK